MIIGLTGGIATGKSTVSNMLRERGAAIVDADRVAREVVEPGEPALQEIVNRFGSEILNEDGTLNRKKLGGIVFADPARRKELEAITHPAIRARMRERMAALASEDPDRLIVADIPLLFEGGLQRQYECVLLVYVPREIQKERLMKRDGLTEAEAEKRLAAQMDIEEKKRLADYVIDNRGTLEETSRQVDEFLRSLDGPKRKKP
jgi:dephospho-CoA kinase